MSAAKTPKEAVLAFPEKEKMVGVDDPEKEYGTIAAGSNCDQLILAENEEGETLWIATGLMAKAETFAWEYRLRNSLAREEQ